MDYNRDLVSANLTKATSATSEKADSATSEKADSVTSEKADLLWLARFLMFKEMQEPSPSRCFHGGRRKMA